MVRKKRIRKPFSADGAASSDVGILEGDVTLALENGTAIVYNYETELFVPTGTVTGIIKHIGAIVYNFMKW